MIDPRNKQHMTVIDTIAGADLEMGNVVKLQNHGDIFLRAVKVAGVAEVSAITGPLLAYWINERSTSTNYSGGADSLTFPVTAASDLDSIHYIPSGSRMLAVGGKGIGEVRVFKESLDTEFASTLPSVGDELHYSTDEAKLCSSGNPQASTSPIALVLEADAVSVSVVLG